MSNKTEITISWASLLRILVISGLAVALIFVKEAILMLLLAIVISSAVDVPVSFLKNKFNIPRILGAILIYSVVIFCVAFLFYIVLPVVILEVGSLATTLRGTSVGSAFSDLSSFLKLGTKLTDLSSLSKLTDLIIKSSSPIFQTIGNIFSGIAFFVSSIIISFYMTLSRDGVSRFLKAVLPDSAEERVLEIYQRTRKKIALWLQGQILLSVIIGLSVSISLWVLGVKYALALGLLAGLFEILPVVGPVFSGAVGTLVAVSQSTTLGLYALFAFVAIQQLENHILVPVIMKKVVDIHPVAALFSLVAGYQLFGVVGMVLSVPVTVVIQDILEERLRRREHRKGRSAEDVLIEENGD